MTQGFTPLRESYAKTQHDHLALPDGRKIGAVGTELTSILIDLDIPGATPSNGREANASAYAAHLDNIGAIAAREAVAAWLVENAQ